MGIKRGRIIFRDPTNKCWPTGKGWPSPFRGIGRGMGLIHYKPTAGCDPGDGVKREGGPIITSPGGTHGGGEHGRWPESEKQRRWPDGRSRDRWHKKGVEII